MSKKSVLLSIGGLVVVVGGLAAAKASQIGSMIEAGKAFVPPPQSVTSTQVEATQWEPTLPAVGSVVAAHLVTLASEVPGTVVKLNFESGRAVRQGEVLLELDTSVEATQLESALAQQTLAGITKKRTTDLVRANAKTPSELDVADANVRQADASVANWRASIAKKTLRAPFSGRLGIRAVEVGQVLAPGTPVVTLTSFDPVYVDFFLPQQALAQLTVEQKVRVTSDAFTSQTWEGKISAINTEVDVGSRNIKVRAQLATKDERLRQGMFVDVEVVLPDSKPVLIVAATAVIHAPYGDSVFVIEPDKDASGKEKMVARQKFVRLGDRRGDMVAIESGLNAGQTVVSAGAFKLQNGVSVVVNNQLAPDAKVAPQPSDT